MDPLVIFVVLTAVAVLCMLTSRSKSKQPVVVPEQVNEIKRITDITETDPPVYLRKSQHIHNIRECYARGGIYSRETGKCTMKPYAFR